MPQILVVDDEEALRCSLKALLSQKGYACHDVENGASLMAHLAQKGESLDLILLDVQLPDRHGIELLPEIKSLFPHLPVLLMTGFGSVAQSVEAMRLGAEDYILKPFNIAELLLRIERCMEKGALKEEVAYLNSQLHGSWDKQYVQGKSASMQKIWAHLQVIAASNSSTVCIQGETGTGKEVIAKRIHDLSQRRLKPFIAINASALTEELLESELFGYEAGAFTGAFKTKKGLFEMASQGTLFLDEIADMGMALQSKILRALQERKIRRVGGTEWIDIDIRLITATHKDLVEQVKLGNFRQDLFYRLHVVPLYLPPLRERREDIELLLQHFIAEFNGELKREVKSIAPPALERLLQYDWPGNIRELRNFVERTLLLECNGTVLLPEHVHLPGLDSPIEKRRSIGENIPLEMVEREHIEGVLRSHDGNKNQAAAILGIDRTTLYNKLKKYQQNS